MVKKIFSKAILVIIAVLAVIAVVCGAALGILYKTSGSIMANDFKINSAFSVTVTVDGEPCEINSWESIRDKRHYIFLPSDADGDSVQISSQELNNEYKIRGGGYSEYNLDINGAKYNTVFLKSDKIPSVHINLTDKSYSDIASDKTLKSAADIRIFADGQCVLNTSLKHIKGRGNASWEDPQKSFNIKFNEKTDLFQMGEAKKYALVSTFNDQTLIKNCYAFTLADMVGLKHISEYQPVDLYIDNNYLGTYLLTENIEVNKSRVSINNIDNDNEAANQGVNLDEAELVTDADDLNSAASGTGRWYDGLNNPEDISSGYLIELDLSARYIEEGSGFVSAHGQPVVVHSPEFATKQELDYIRTLYQSFEDAAYSEDGYNEQGGYYLDYIDGEALAQLYLIQELSKNKDANITSTYLYVGKSGKINAGPVWDFDNAFGNQVKLGNMNDPGRVMPEEWLVGFDTNKQGFDGIFKILMKHSDFRSIASSVWREQFTPALDKISVIDDSRQLLEASAVMNGLRWNRYNSSDYDGNAERFDRALNELSDFIAARRAVMDKAFSGDTRALHYDPNGVSTPLGQGVFAAAGEQITVQGSPYVTDLKFLGWSTEPDGSGDFYNEGDTLELIDDVTLYAQWGDTSAVLKLKNKLKPMVEKVTNSFRYRVKVVTG